MTLNDMLAALAPSRPLPGEAARLALLPEYRRAPPENLNADPAYWRDAAVLVLLYPAGEDIRFPLIQRVSGSGVHAGQVSLPGGAREGDETPEDCALRETREELGVDSAAIRVVRELSPLHIPPSRFLVRPFVGVLEEPPVFQPAPAEVEYCFETSLDELLRPGVRTEDLMEREGRLWRIPFYRLAGRRVWGATAMILAELEAMIDKG